MTDGKIIYSCPFVPAEWIAAHGFSPSRIVPRSHPDTDLLDNAPGICPFARAFANTAASIDASAVVVTTACDQMRRGYDFIERIAGKPTFLMNVPNTWESPSSQKLYASELERLGRFLVRLGGTSPSWDKLTAIMREYDVNRSRLRRSYGSMPPRRFSELIADFNRDPSTIMASDGNVYIPQGIPLALVGGPLMREHFEIFDNVEDAGYIALDATETGERTIPPPYDRRRMTDEPFELMVDSYFGGIPDAARRPNSLLYQWLRKEIDARGIKGVIFLRYVWCDIWHAEAQRMKDWLGLPFFDLDITEDANDNSRRLTRLQAFMEMLK
ncbi:MAG: 2-hydroxyacyl-CoA dehydratase [Armatimonadota bacterium]